MKREKILDCTYTMLSPELKQVWRHILYKKLEHEWLQAVLHETFDGDLKWYIEGFLEKIELDEDYETCSGIIDLINEYSAILDKQ